MWLGESGDDDEQDEEQHDQEAEQDGDDDEGDEEGEDGEVERSSASDTDPETEEDILQGGVVVRPDGVDMQAHFKAQRRSALKSSVLRQK